MRLLAEGDEGMRRGQAGTEEAVGFTSFETEVAQRVSKTMRVLEPLSAVDVMRWVDYRESAGTFSEERRHS
ncbi:hypothetical protein J3R82DRAFT_8605 [Butyriboletus roseoflavus]|nr:hypothetical protein J3R82DRAFT_8605 [Butyriboletus roseoflavus]